MDNKLNILVKLLNLDEQELVEVAISINDGLNKFVDWKYFKEPAVRDKYTKILDIKDKYTIISVREINSVIIKEI